MSRNSNKKRENKIILGLPGDIMREQTEQLFLRAGYNISLGKHYCQAEIDEPAIDIVLTKEEDLPLYLAKGRVDAAICQNAFLRDQKAEVERICSFKYGVGIWEKARLVLAVPQQGNIKSPQDLEGETVIARVPHLAEEYFEKQGVKVNIEPSGRPSEPKVPLLGKALIELTNTGNTLRTFNLKILDVLMVTSPTLVVNKEAAQDSWKKSKLEDLGLLLQGTRRAIGMTGLFLHACNKKMEEVLDILPAMKKPTITQLRGEDWFEVFTVADKKKLRRIIPHLKEIGCRDIVEFPLDKVIL